MPSNVRETNTNYVLGIRRTLSPSSVYCIQCRLLSSLVFPRQAASISSPSLSDGGTIQNAGAHTRSRTDNLLRDLLPTPALLLLAGTLPPPRRLPLPLPSAISAPLVRSFVCRLVVVHRRLRIKVEPLPGLQRRQHRRVKVHRVGVPDGRQHRRRRLPPRPLGRSPALLPPLKSSPCPASAPIVVVVAAAVVALAPPRRRRLHAHPTTTTTTTTAPVRRFRYWASLRERLERLRDAGCE
jgi:hypothetical protein